MRCQSRHKEFHAVFSCTDEATKKIVVTTLVPHLNGKKQVKTRCLCDFHAKRFRNKLNRQIDQLQKTKSYLEENI